MVKAKFRLKFQRRTNDNPEYFIAKGIFETEINYWSVVFKNDLVKVNDGVPVAINQMHAYTNNIRYCADYDKNYAIENQKVVFSIALNNGQTLSGDGMIESVFLYKRPFINWFNKLCNMSSP